MRTQGGKRGTLGGGPTKSLGFTWGVENTVVDLWEMSDFSYTQNYDLQMWIILGLSCSKNLFI